MLFKSMKSIVKKNSLLWGKDVAEDYHGMAARDMQSHWDSFIEPTVRKHAINYTHTIDFACGFGRNTDYLLNRAGRVTMVDVNPDNIAHCREKYKAEPRVEVVPCNGYSLSNIASKTCTFFYTFDSMVHFPQEIVRAYMPEFFRVITPGGYALIHHSNYTGGGPRGNFKKNPHWRNYMSAELFAEIAQGAGFTIDEQIIFPWELPDLDCISLLRKS